MKNRQKTISKGNYHFELFIKRKEYERKYDRGCKGVVL